ncbi:MAG: hypothetical protein NT090_24720 [Acidobacteria bacterium]|nr:hypothetical protein [Acidobacteriota bacterium]
MRRIEMALIVALLAGPAWAQRQKLTINAETPEGQLLAQIGQEPDEGKKLAMMDDFAAKYPKHEAVGWVYEQMVPVCQKASQFDKGLAACDKLLTLDPEDAGSAHACLKLAEAKKDPDAIKAWSARASQVARKVASSPKPKEEDEVEGWKQRVDFAKQLDIYTEYALYAATLATPEAKKKAELMGEIEQRDEKYEHLPMLRDHVFRALWAANDAPGAMAMAGRLSQKGQASDEMLLGAAEGALNQKDFDTALLFAGKLIGALPAKPKPASVAEADWEAKKTKALASAYFIEGSAYANQNKYVEADKSLRAGLPYMKDNEQLLAGAYFYLGLANFKLGDAKTPDTARLLDAIKFNQQCAAIKGPFQALAQRNLKVIKTQFQIQQ